MIEKRPGGARGRRQGAVWPLLFRQPSWPLPSRTRDTKASQWTRNPGQRWPIAGQFCSSPCQFRSRQIPDNFGGIRGKVGRVWGNCGPFRAKFVRYLSKPGNIWQTSTHTHLVSIFRAKAGATRAKFAQIRAKCGRSRAELGRTLFNIGYTLAQV